jgi:osmoprotectant transport system substrate-binding protein
VKKKWMKGLVLIMVLSLAVVGVVGCGGSETAGDDPTIIVGSKTFTEALLLGELTYQYLDGLGYPSVASQPLSGSLLFP